MAFTDEQRQALKAKLSFRHVKTRASNGSTIPYVEGWHVIGEANRIFGYDSWDRTTLSPRCVWSEMQRGQTACFYTAKVRITVRAGGETIVREGIGTGVGRSATPELAHEIALKAAETDATKRALATFGNPFGLALYDKEKLHVTKSRRNQAQPTALEAANGAGPHTVAHDFVLVRGDGRKQCFETAEAFVGATLTLVPTLPTIESLYAFWEANTESFAALKEAAGSPGTDPVPAIVSSLKARARVLGRSGPQINAASDRPRVTKPALAIPKEKRLRNKVHLAFVANQPCLICGRRPAHAHHLRFAQPRAMALKVSDEFTVPLCAGHHDSLHKTGDEQAWWARHGIIDPLKIAARLWAASHHGEMVEAESEENEDGAVPAEIVTRADGDCAVDVPASFADRANDQAPSKAGA